MNNVAVIMSVQISVHSFGYMHRNETTGLCGNSVLNFLRSSKLFCTGPAPFYIFYQQWGMVLISPHPSPILVIFLFFFNNNHPDGCEVVSCGFDLHSPWILNIPVPPVELTCPSTQ